jgi:ATP-dependent protease ClpP protease subunit
MGSIILQAADHRIMMPNSKFMIHNGTSSYINMSLPLAKKWVHEEERINEDMENIYLESMYRKDPQDLLKTLSNILNKPLSKKQSIKDILKEMLNFDTILTADETVQLGFADSVYSVE